MTNTVLTTLGTKMPSEKYMLQRVQMGLQTPPSHTVTLGGYRSQTHLIHLGGSVHVSMQQCGADVFMIQCTDCVFNRSLAHFTRVQSRPFSHRGQGAH